ncbi:glycosyltransferase [Nocardioides sp.]|uniref:glycosyltransferase n=1 Tax=Nocardioides sp. TaxID=35761 RepID=UPI00356132B2
MFVPFDPTVRVHLGVVTLGTPPRLGGCLEALVAHESRHDFVVSVLINAATALEEPLAFDAPPGVRVEASASNLGWAGGIQRLRPLGTGDYFVWVQDDMVPAPGWLDALVGAADTHPRVGAFGALRVDESDNVLLHNAGSTSPPDQVALWNQTDETAEIRPREVSSYEWITAKGMLSRLEAFDEVGGPDPSLWPLHHVDKDFSVHLRCHGWEVALVPGARLIHQQSQSAPSLFRGFLKTWREEQFDARWSGPVTELAGRPAADVDHECARWKDLRVDAVEAAAGREASRLAVPFARFAAGRAGEAAEREQVLRAAIARRDEALVLAAKVRKRLKRAKARLAELEAQQANGTPSTPPGTRLSARLRARLRARFGPGRRR